MPSDIKQLRSLLGGLSYYNKFLPNLDRRIRPVMGLLKKGDVFTFTPDMERIVRELLAELVAPPILVFPDWDAVIDKSRSFCRYQHRRFGCNPRTGTVGWFNSPHRIHRPRHTR